MVKTGDAIDGTLYGKASIKNVDFTGLMFEVEFEYLKHNIILNKSMIELLISITPKELSKYYDDLFNRTCDVPTKEIDDNKVLATDFKRKANE